MTTHNVMDQALEVLARKSISREKLREKLLNAEFSEEEITDCLRRLDGWGYLNDRQLIIDKIEGLKKKFKGRAYIGSHLRHLGLSVELIDQLLDEYYPLELEMVIAQQALAKRRGRNNHPKAGDSFFLLRSGFAEDTVERCFLKRSF